MSIKTINVIKRKKITLLLAHLTALCRIKCHKLYLLKINGEKKNKYARELVLIACVVGTTAPSRLDVNVRQRNVTRHDRGRRRLHHDSVRSRWQHHTHVIFGDRFCN